MATPKTIIWDRDPHTAEKHALLRSYLDAWWPILFQGGFPGATYAEGFAGPGQYRGDHDGSPVIAMRSLMEQPKPLPPHTARFVLVDDDARRVEHLRAHMARRCPDVPRNVSLDIRQGDCGTALLPALDEHAVWGEPVFAFLDPFSAAVPYTVVRRVGENPSSEVLVTFMSDQLRRWARKQDQEEGDAMFGDWQWREVAEQPREEKIRWLITLYRKRLKDAGFVYRTAFELVDERGTAFFLIHGTKDRQGLQKMKDAMWKVDRVHGTRFRDPRDPNQIEFDIGAAEPDLRGLEHLLAEQLAGGEPANVSDLRTWALESTVFRPPHVRKVLQKWRHKGWVSTDNNRLPESATVRLEVQPDVGPTPRQGMLDLPPRD